MKMKTIFQLRNFLRLKPKIVFFHRYNHSVSASLTPSSDPSVENLRIRRQLALSYRILDRLQLNEGVCNHLTAIAPAKNGQGEVMLVIPGNLPDGSSQHWSEVTASSLIGLDKSGNVVEEGNLGGEPELSAACIHVGIRKVRPDAKVIMHTHSPYSTAIGCLKDPSLLMIHQTGIRFLDRIALHTDYDMPTAMEEGENIGKSLKDKDVLFMMNHGILVASQTVHVAFDEIYYLERACMNQVLALSALGGNRDGLAMLPDSVTRETKKTYTSENIDLYAKRHFYSYWRMYADQHPDVFE